MICRCRICGCWCRVAATTSPRISLGASSLRSPRTVFITLPARSQVASVLLSVLLVAAGPCSVESETQIFRTAEAVKRSGAVALRAGAFKPRTSPYDFQGMELEGLRLLRKAPRNAHRR